MDQPAHHAAELAAAYSDVHRCSTHDRGSSDSYIHDGSAHAHVHGKSDCYPGAAHCHNGTSTHSYGYSDDSRHPVGRTALEYRQGGIINWKYGP